MQMILAVAMGGAVGAVLRYLASSAVTRMLPGAFPFGTMAVNLLGSLCLGLFLSLMAQTFEAREEVRAFLAVGLLGSFTTFSTFSMDTVQLIERGEWMAAAGYATGSLLLGLFAFMGGLWIGKGLA